MFPIGYCISSVCVLLKRTKSTDENSLLFSSTVIFSRESSINAPVPICLTLAGIFISFKSVHSSNAAILILSTPSGIVISANFPHLKKASLPMVFKSPESVTSLRFEQ